MKNYTSSHENKKALNPFYHKKILTENECKAPIGRRYEERHDFNNFVRVTRM